MQTVTVLLAGLLYAAGIYLLLSTFVVRMLIGLVLLSNAVNLTILAAGRIGPTAPAFVPGDADALAAAGVANPLPQALILTAIVISFSFFAFLLVLSARAYEDLGTDDVRRMRVAEPEDDALPPPGY